MRGRGKLHTHIRAGVDVGPGGDQHLQAFWVSVGCAKDGGQSTLDNVNKPVRKKVTK